MPIFLKRVYEKPSPQDGCRVLVERLWPRGLSKDKAKIDLWMKNTAPSPGLRTWFGHDPTKWNEFRKRYFAELDQQEKEIDGLLTQIQKGSVTFVFASKEEQYNNAVAFKEYLEHRMR